MLAGIDEAIAGCQDAISLIKRYYADNADEVARFGNFPSLYGGLVTEDGSLEHYHGRMRFVDADGKVLENGIDPGDYLDYIAETTEEWSYLKFPYFKRVGYPEGAYRVGPLGRLNVAESARTPLANEELNSFKALGNGRPVQGTLYYHYARMIEALYAVERARQLLEDPEIMGRDIVASSNGLQPRGVGVIEAPRGTLFHDYHVDETGRLESEPDRLHRAEQRGDERSRRLGRPRVGGWQQAARGDAQPRGSRYPRLRPVPLLLHARHRPDADCRGAHRPGWRAARPRGPVG